MARGEGLYKRPDSRFWWASWIGADGKPQRRSTKTENKAGARALLSRWRAEAWSQQTGLADPSASTTPAPSARSTTTLEQLQEIWELEHHGDTLKSGRCRWANVYRVLGGAQRRAAEVTHAELQHLRVVLAQTRQRSTVNMHLSMLRSSYRMAIERGLLTEDPTQGLKAYPVHDQRDRVMSPAEERLLLDAAKPEVARVIILAVDTGLRRGELAQLSWAHIDMEARVISLPGRVAKNKRAWQVPLTARAAKLLAGLDRNEPIVPYTAGSLSPVFKRLCDQVGIQDLRLHDLRHTCATRLRRAGVDWFTVMRLLNHKSPKTAARYQTIDEQDLTGAAAKLSRWTEAKL